MVYPVPHKFVLTRKLRWFVHTNLSRQFFQVTVSRASSPGTSQQTRDNTDPACVISVDCARGFALLHWLNLRYGLHCFVFYGCIVVYPVCQRLWMTTLGARGGGGYSQKNWVGVCGPLPKTLTLFMAKTCEIPYPIYDLALKSKPCFRAAL